MNDKDKQIRQMACAMCGQDKICGDVGVEKCVLYPDYRKQARRLYEKGYRKQSKGEWLCQYDTDYGTTDVTCSVCGDTRAINGCYVDIHDKSIYAEDNFCPNCGAKMKDDAD